MPVALLISAASAGEFLGIVGAAVGNITGWVLMHAVKAAEMTISFGQSDNILLAPQISLSTMLATTFIVILVTLLGAVEPAYKAAMRQAAQNYTKHINRQFAMRDYLYFKA